MATLTVLAWLLAFFIIISIFANAAEEGDIDKAGGAFFGLAIVSLIIAAGIYWDTTGMLPTSEASGGMRSLIGAFLNLRFLLIAGLVADGLLGVLGLIFVGRNSSGNSSVGSWILNAIGLLSSILGIVSFYLDHLR